MATIDVLVKECDAFQLNFSGPEDFISVIKQLQYHISANGFHLHGADP